MLPRILVPAVMVGTLLVTGPAWSFGCAIEPSSINCAPAPINAPRYVAPVPQYAVPVPQYTPPPAPRYDYEGAVRRQLEPQGGYLDQDLQNLNRALIYRGQGRNPY